MRRNSVLVVAAAMVVVLSVSLPVPMPVRAASAASGVALVAAATVDITQHRLPNRLVALAGAPPVAVACAVGSVEMIGTVVAGALLGGGSMLAVYVVRGVGMGDVKAAAAIGASCAVVSPWAAPSAIAIAACVAAGYATLRRRRALPLGPSLCAGWATALAFAGWTS